MWELSHLKLFVGDIGRLILCNDFIAKCLQKKRFDYTLTDRTSQTNIHSYLLLTESNAGNHRCPEERVSPTEQCHLGARGFHLDDSEPRNYDCYAMS
jgi:hypothetical protein